MEERSLLYPSFADSAQLQQIKWYIEKAGFFLTNVEQIAEPDRKFA